MFAAGDVGGFRGGSCNAGRAGEHQLWVDQFGKPVGFRVATIAADGVVLGLECFTDFILIATFLGQVIAGFTGKGGVVFLCGLQALGGFGQVGVVLDGAGAQFGGQQQSAACTDYPVCIGAQLETLPTGLATEVTRMGQVTQIKRGVIVVTHQRRADLPGGVVQA
ncbi:hypothetical protein D3C79_789800 [compost metagenome]